MYASTRDLLSFIISLSVGSCSRTAGRDHPMPGLESGSESNLKITPETISLVPNGSGFLSLQGVVSADGNLGPMPRSVPLAPSSKHSARSGHVANSGFAKPERFSVQAFLHEHCGSISQFLGGGQLCRDYDYEKVNVPTLDWDLSRMQSQIKAGEDLPTEEEDEVRGDEISMAFPSRLTQPIGLLALLDDIDLYFDFSKPLSLQLRYVRAYEGPDSGIYFHYTQKEYEQLAPDKKRFVKPIARVVTTRLRGATPPQKSGLDIANDETTCPQHGGYLGRADVVSPILDETVFQECSDRWGPDHVYFERCLMIRGCEARTQHHGEGGILRPFKHGTHLGGLKQDRLATLPMPMCCARSVRAALRIWVQRRLVYDSLGISPPAELEHEIQHVSTDLREYRLADYGHGHAMLGMHKVRDVYKVFSSGGLMTFVKNVIKTVKKDLRQFLKDVEAMGYIIAGKKQPQPQPTSNATQKAAVRTSAGVSARVKKYWKEIVHYGSEVLGYAVKALKKGAKWLLKHGMSLTKWIVEHPQGAILLSAIILSLRQRLCTYFSEVWFLEMGHGGKEVHEMDPGEYLWKVGKDAFHHTVPNRKQLVEVITKFAADHSYWKTLSKFAMHAFEGAFAIFGLGNPAISGFIELIGAVVLDSTKRGVKYELFKMLMPPEKKKTPLQSAMEPYAQLQKDVGDLFFAPCFLRPTELKIINPFAEGADDPEEELLNFEDPF